VDIMSDVDGNRRDDDDGDFDDADGNRIDGATAVAVLEYLVKELVDDPDAVEVDTVDGRRGTTLEVSVGPGDMGRVIGRRGRIATAIRTLVRAAAAKDGSEVDVDFVD
jgi:predicted RNA-binding protein YlqC (UPF0109 family)